MAVSLDDRTKLRTTISGRWTAHSRAPSGAAPCEPYWTRNAGQHDGDRVQPPPAGRDRRRSSRREKALLWSDVLPHLTRRAEGAIRSAGGGVRRGFRFPYRTSLRAPFDIRPPRRNHYRRYVAQRRKATPIGRSTAPTWRHRTAAGINDGKGFVFISHTGEIYPSGVSGDFRGQRAPPLVSLELTVIPACSARCAIAASW
jgi:hypothetical protein